MFWTWNTGYIFAKLEGNAPVAQTAAHSFTYHIGGFKNGENAMRIIKLPLQKSNDQQNIHQQQISQINIHIKVDINAWFNGKESIQIATNPICHSPGKLAMHFADNYAQMFSIMQPWKLLAPYYSHLYWYLLQ